MFKILILHTISHNEEILLLRPKWLNTPFIFVGYLIILVKLAKTDYKVITKLIVVSSVSLSVSVVFFLKVVPFIPFSSFVSSILSFTSISSPFSGSSSPFCPLFHFLYFLLSLSSWFLVMAPVFNIRDPVVNCRRINIVGERYWRRYWGNDIGRWIGERGMDRIG